MMTCDNVSRYEFHHPYCLQFSVFRFSWSSDIQITNNFSTNYRSCTLQNVLPVRGRQDELPRRRWAGPWPGAPELPAPGPRQVPRAARAQQTQLRADRRRHAEVSSCRLVTRTGISSSSIIICRHEEAQRAAEAMLSSSVASSFNSSSSVASQTPSLPSYGSYLQHHQLPLPLPHPQHNQVRVENWKRWCRNAE